MSIGSAENADIDKHKNKDKFKSNRRSHVQANGMQNEALTTNEEHSKENLEKDIEKKPPFM